MSDGWMDGQKDRETDRWTGGQMYRLTDQWTEGQTDRHRQMDKETDGPTNQQSDL